MIDTGFPRVLLNSNYFSGVGSDRYLVGVNGKAEKVEIKHVDLRIGSVAKKRVFTEIADLSALEQKKNIRLLGMIGSSFFKDFELIFDYPNKELTLYRLNKKGTKLVWDWFYRSPAELLKYKLKGHLPVMEARVNGLRLKLAIDSGAESNLFDDRHFESLGPYLRNRRITRVAGLGPKTKEVPVAALINVEIGRINYAPMRTMFSNITPFSKPLAGPKLDGIVGYEFLSQFKTGINFKRKEIYIWPEENLEGRPADLFTRSPKGKQKKRSLN